MALQSRQCFRCGLRLAGDEEARGYRLVEIYGEAPGRVWRRDPPFDRVVDLCRPCILRVVDTIAVSPLHGRPEAVELVEEVEPSAAPEPGPVHRRADDRLEAAELPAELPAERADQEPPVRPAMRLLRRRLRPADGDEPAAEQVKAGRPPRWLTQINNGGFR